MSQPDPSSLLSKGRAEIDPVVLPHGFVWGDEQSGTSSGGPFSSGSYIRGDRRLELSFRWNLGLVRYCVGGTSVGHEDYMRYLGHRATARFPGFHSDPLVGFTRLADDLRDYGGDFLFGNAASVAEAAAAASVRAERGVARRPDLP
jgi:hypothetical protein